MNWTWNWIYCLLEFSFKLTTFLVRKNFFNSIDLKKFSKKQDKQKNKNLFAEEGFRRLKRLVLSPLSWLCCCGCGCVVVVVVVWLWLCGCVVVWLCGCVVVRLFSNKFLPVPSDYSSITLSELPSIENFIQKPPSPPKGEGDPEFIAEEGWVDNKVRTIIQHFEEDDFSPPACRVPPLALVRCTRGGKSRALKEIEWALFQKYKEEGDVVVLRI